MQNPIEAPALPLLSIVSPVYNASTILSELVARIVEATNSLDADIEIILVDDGSLDSSWALIQTLCGREPRLRGVKLTRNFGQQAAITAGLAECIGQYAIVLDCDLQDDPSYIPELLHQAEKGFDVVLTRKKSRKYHPLRNALTRLFYRFLSATGDLPGIDAHVNGYILINRRVIETFASFKDYRRDFLMLVRWLGFKHTVIEVEHATRYDGNSSYSLVTLVKGAIALITAHSKTLLMVSIVLGFLYVASAFLAVVYLIVNYYIHGYRPGWASTIVLMLGSTGLILLGIGVLGIYIGHILDQTRGRPLYVIQERASASLFSAQPKRE